MMSDREILSNIRDHISGLEMQIRLLNQLLTGNGEPSKGLIIRVDRMERAGKFVKFLLASLYVAGLGAVAKWLFLS